MKNVTKRVKKICNAKHEQANKWKYLKSAEQFLICKLLKKHEKNDSALGNYACTDYHLIHRKMSTIPYSTNSYSKSTIRKSENRNW